MQPDRTTLDEERRSNRSRIAVQARLCSILAFSVQPRIGIFVVAVIDAALVYLLPHRPHHLPAYPVVAILGVTNILISIAIFVRARPFTLFAAGSSLGAFVLGAILLVPPAPGV